MRNIKVTQVKSLIGRPERQKATLRALGLSKINASVVKAETVQIKGMIAKISHLVNVEEC